MIYECGLQGNVLQNLDLRLSTLPKILRGQIPVGVPDQSPRVFDSIPPIGTRRYTC